MRIAIIGTNGFLSTSIAKYVIEKGWSLDMYGLDKPIHHTYSHFYSIDLLQGEIEIKELSKSDIIVYAVGAGIQSDLNEGANLIYALNVYAPVRICDALKQADYKGGFVTFGSYFELGETDIQRPAAEDDVINAKSSAPTDYVVSKRMLTRFVTSYKHDFVHWHFILPTIYGPGESPKRLIPYTIDTIRKGEKLHFTNGEQIRQYLYVGEVARVLEKAYLAFLPSGVYNIEGNEILSVRDLVRIIHDSFNKQIKEDCFGDVTRSDTNMKYLALDGRKLSDAIIWKPNNSLREEICKY